MKKTAAGLALVAALLWVGWGIYRYNSFNVKGVLPDATELETLDKSRFTRSMLPQIMLVTRSTNPEDPSSRLHRTFAILSFNIPKSKWEVAYRSDWEGKIEYSVGELTPEKMKVVLIKDLNPGSMGGMGYKVVSYANKQFESLQENFAQAVALKDNTIFENVDMGLVTLYEWKNGRFIETASKSNYSSPRPVNAQTLNYSSEKGYIEIDKDQITLKVGETLYLNRNGKGPEIDIMRMAGDCVDFVSPSVENVKAIKEGRCELQIMLAPKEWQTAKIVKVIVKI